MDKRKTVLLVEDDPGIQELLALIIGRERFEVVTAGDGREALDAIGKDGLPDLILLDIMMPRMDGIEFAAEFHELYDHLRPIVVMTAASDAAAKAREVEAAGLLAKPFDINAIRGILHDHLG